MKRVLHILPNAHLDPVWLWDWREGLNEGIATCRSMLALMDEFSELTFMRGEASIYRQLEEFDPETFARIRAMVEAGRWDPVGGNWVQSDTNIPDTATFVKQYAVGKEYFRKTFGFEVTAAWAADSFGHSAGLPELYRHAGLKYFAFCRPAENLLHIDKPLFRWRGQGGADVLSWRCPVGWYGSERGEVTGRLDGVLDSPDYGLVNHAVFLGLGDHGGGTSRRQVREVLAWRERHPEIEVRFSTLHGFFAAAEADIAGKPDDFIPTFEGELNFCLRGCHSSAAKIKWNFRRAEAQLKRAEAVMNFTAPLTGVTPDPMAESWNGLLFNTFHDILPGSCIRRAAHEQMEWLGGILHDARTCEFAALDRLAGKIGVSTAVPGEDMPLAVPRLFFNAAPRPFEGYVEVESCLDYRPNFDYRENPDDFPFEVTDEDDRPVAFQRIDTEMEAIPLFPWRRRALVKLAIPPGGWRIVKSAFVQTPRRTPFAGTPVTAEANRIANEFYAVSVKPGDFALKITRADGTPVLAKNGLEFAAFRDEYGAWGGMAEEPDAFLCPDRSETWIAEEVKLLEAGPMRAKLFVRFAGRHSQLGFEVSVSAGRNAVDCTGTLLWQDRAVRLRLVADAIEEATYAVPGGTVSRRVEGDVPGGRWVTVRQGERRTALVSDVLTGYGSFDGRFGVNLIRGCRATSDIVSNASVFPERPPLDQGEHTFRLTVSDDADAAPQLADELELPPAEIMCWPHPGELKMCGETVEVMPAEVKCLAVRACDGKLVLTLQAPAAVRAAVRFGGRLLAEAELEAWRITDVAGALQ